MLRDILGRVKASAAVVLHAWSTTKKKDLVLSNGNRTATQAVEIAGGNWVYSDTDILGSVYIEIQCFFSNLEYQYIGLVPSGTTPVNASTPPAGSSVSPSQTNQNGLYSISYNASSGAYKIKKNNVQIASGTNARSDMRVWYSCRSYGGTGAYAIINSGQVAFTYTPEYL